MEIITGVSENCGSLYAGSLAVAMIRIIACWAVHGGPTFGNSRFDC